MAANGVPSKKTPILCRGHSRQVPQFSYSDVLEDGNFYIVSSCLDGKPMMRDGTTGDWVGTFVGHKGAVWSSRINSTATRVATASADYTARIWDAITGEEMFCFTQSKVVKTVDFSSQGTQIVTGGVEKTLRLYDLEQLGSEPSILGSHTESIKTVLWTKEDSVVLSMGSEGSVYIWDLRTKSKVRTIEMDSPISAISLTTDGSLLTTIANKQVKFWNSKTFEPVKTLSVPASVVSASVENGPSPSIVVTGGSDNWVRIFNYEDGKEMELIKGHHGPVNCVGFAPDSKTFATGSDDGTIRLWLAQEMPYGLWERETEISSNGPPKDGDPQSTLSSSFGSNASSRKHRSPSSNAPAVDGEHRSRRNSYSTSGGSRKAPGNSPAGRNNPKFSFSNSSSRGGRQGNWDPNKK
eukprot:CAMPEP_0201475364 /NCGR_PEP_ID=MMETSP0151_2-20130828/783_1 /ASSEMBLY_ACC=CAM_ASM_000257 /TAXON_ID=200890 /ORGANISM="Paramoeba atlantica, Strain 621/1 / CCAP 1560/9" /LENGTH=408 /DNA_ID=CAMNT_0047855423 /DNA_START=200 /DNA_END=1426 /DNA_ORIENTATION=+